MASLANAMHHSLLCGMRPQSAESRHSGDSSHRDLPPLPRSSSSYSSNTEEPATVSVEKHPTVPIWPDEPQTLDHRDWLTILSCIGDVLVILCATLFFVYGSLILYYDGMSIEKISKLSLLRDASRYGPTVFPILFAAIVGQAMHAIAHWRLENGERMRVLDQLLGSTGLFATIVTQLKFRNMGFIGVALIILWILSPIGGQASLRILDFDTTTSIRSRSLYYLDRNSTYHRADQTLLGADGHNAVFVSQALFAAALGSTKDTQESSMDSWGNVKIPMIEHISSFQGQDGWYSLDQSSNVTYSSLLGVPLSRMSSEYNTTFNMETWYWTLDCPVLFQLNETTTGQATLPGEEGTSSNTSLFAREANDNDVRRRDEPLRWWVGSSHAWSLSSPNPIPRIYETGGNITKRIFHYRSQDDDRGGSSNGTRAECYMSTTYVEVEAYCMTRSCSVKRIRPSKQSHPPREHALGIDPHYPYFTKDFHDAININSFRLPTPLQRYFVEPFAAYTRLNASLDLYKLPKPEFSYRLAQLMNTYWQASINLGQVTSGIPPDDEVIYDINRRNASLLRMQEIINGEDGKTWMTTPPDPTIVPPLYRSINATESITIPVLKCQRPWLAALFIATGAMFISGVFGLVLECTRKAPDFALNVSSLTRDNPYIRLPPGGSTLDSIDRTRLLRNVKIRLGDIKPDDPVGYVAIASYDKGERVEKLRGLERTRTFM